MAAGPQHVVWGVDALFTSGQVTGVLKVLMALILSPLIGFWVGFLVHRLMATLLRAARPLPGSSLAISSRWHCWLGVERRAATSSEDDASGRLVMAMRSEFILVRMASRLPPWAPDFFALVDDQCDQAVKTMDELVTFMESHKNKSAKHVRRMEKEGDRLKRRNLDILNKAFSTPMDREDSYRAIVDIDELMNYAKSTVREMELFGVMPDRFTLQMAVELRQGTEALRQGFSMLRKDIILAEGGVEAAHKAERNVEKAYRRALVEFFDIDGVTAPAGASKRGSGGNGDLYQQVLREVMDRMKRREIYRHLSNSADRLARAGNTLHDIVVKIT